MSEHLSERQLADLRRRLQQRHDELRAEVRQELEDSGNQNYIHLTEGGRDAGDASVADELADLNLSIVQRHIEEMRDIELALARMENGSYGLCIDDAAEIDIKRLQANPTAKRCIACQTRYENTHAQPGHPTL